MEAGFDQLRQDFDCYRRDPAALAQDLSKALSTVDENSGKGLRLRLLLAEARKRCGEIEQASADLQHLADEAVRRGDLRLEFEAKLQLANIAFSRGDLGNCRTLGEQTLSLAIQLDDPALTGDAEYQLALPPAMQDRLDESFPRVQRAVELHSSAGDERRLAISRSLLAMLYVKQGRNFEGIQLWRQSLRYYENEGDDLGVAGELQRIGFATWCQGDLEQTRRTLERVLSIFAAWPEAVSPAQRMVIHFNLAHVEMRDRQLAAAEHCFDIAQDLGQKVGDMAMLANLHLARVALELLRDAPADALEQRRLALETAATVNLPFIPLDHMLFALALAANGDWDGARAEWQSGHYKSPDAEQVTMLRGVKLVLDHLWQQATGKERSDYAAWRSELAALLD